jgi:hypothetical protein
MLRLFVFNVGSRLMDWARAALDHERCLLVVVEERWL